MDDDEVLLVLMLLCLCLNMKTPDSRKLLRQSILSPEDSAWAHMYASKCDRAFIIYTGVNVAMFHRLLERFAPLYETTTCYNTGGQYFRRTIRDRHRPRIIPATGALGLALRWCTSICSQHMLITFFGMTQTMVSHYLPYCLSLLLIVLQQDINARISFPNLVEQQLLACMIAYKYPLLRGCIGSIDGLRLPVTSSENDILQERYYNGWHTEHCTNNVLLYLADGTIAACGMNYWGSYHDSTTAHQSGIYDCLLQHMPDNLYIAGDCAFPSIEGRIRRVSKVGESGPQTPDAVAWERSLTALRQCSEWGNNELCNKFPRLKAKWDINDAAFRQLGMLTIVHLHNFRTRLLGRNEIRNIFFYPFLQEYGVDHYVQG